MKNRKQKLSTLANAKGNVYYGMHMYPGIAEYRENNKKFRVFLNENTIRKMDTTFPGCPVYVLHKDEEVSDDIDVVRGEADGWVIESFYNARDGKHWSKLIIVTDAGEMAVRKGWRLSNCYEPTLFGKGGTWNGMDYHKQVLEGEYEHLAIVPDPRYEESIILTPEEFKRYNDDHEIELKRLANSKTKEKKYMGFRLFNRAEVKLDSKLKNALVFLPKSKKEVSLSKLISDADARASGKRMANARDIVKVEDEEFTVSELLEVHGDALDQIDELKRKLKNASKKLKALENEEEEDDEDEEELENSDDEDEMENAEDEEDDDEEDDEDDEDEEVKVKAKNKKKNKKKNSVTSIRRHQKNDDFEAGILDEEEDEEPRKSKKVKNRREDDDFLEDEEEEIEEPIEEKRLSNSQRRELAKKKAKKMKNAEDRHRKNNPDYGDETEFVDTSMDQLARGQDLFGSPQRKAQ